MKALVRRLAIAARDGEVRAAVEDDFHHFRVRMRHDGAEVRDIEAEAFRQPWSACGFAAEELKAFVGMALTVRLSRVLAHTDQSLHCTHMLDLAALSAAAAARGAPHTRRYEAVIPDRMDGRTTPRLSLDGSDILRWTVEHNTITGPDAAGLSLGSGFSRWIDANLDADRAEAFFVLRRAVFIAGGRGVPLDKMPHAPARGACFAQQPSRAPGAIRMIGSTQDFGDRPDDLLIADQDWLSFISAT